MVKKHTRLAVSVFILSFLMFMAVPMNQNQIISDDQSQNDILIEDQAYDTNTTDVADSSSILLHQSHTNYTRINFTENEQIYKVPAPADTDFNTSQIYLGFTNITARNRTLIIENRSADGDIGVNTEDHYTSFTVPMDCVISNLTFSLGSWLPGDDDVADIYLLNATWNETEARNEPAELNEAIDIGDISLIEPDNDVNVTATAINYPLNNDETTNNTWYIGLKGKSGIMRWDYVDDSPTTNRSLAYSWNNGQWDLLSRDYTLQVGVGLASNTPSPSVLGLTVNSTPVSDDSVEESAGSYSSSEVKPGISGELEFNVTSPWYEYTCQVNETIINYTKSNVSPEVFFTAQSPKDPLWNVSAAVGSYEAKFEEKSINFTIPASWYNIRVSLDGVTQTSSIQTAENNQIVTVDSGVDNGEWILLANSSNLLNALDITVDGTPRTFAYTNETVDFEATFDKPIEGDVNLTIYNPSPDPAQNYSKITTLSSPTDTVTLTDWDVASNITVSGLFRVQVTWNNDTDAAILESTVFIAKHTSIDVNPASGYENSTTSTPFNISITYTDLFTAGEPNVTGATVGYNLGLGDGWQSQVQNNPDESYNVTIFPNDFSLGSHVIPITINKSGYYNYSFNYVFNTVRTTQLEYITGSSEITDIIRGHNATLYIQYNTSGFGNAPIDGASISEISLDSGLVWSYEDLTSGLYVIRINTSAVDVGEYECNFTIGKTAYNTLKIDFKIEVIKAELNIELVDGPTEVWKYSGINTTITFRLIDADNSKNITGMPSTFVTVYNGTSPTYEEWGPSTKAWEVGNGLYKVNLSLSGLPAGPLANHSAIINVSYEPNYESYNITADFKIIGNSTAFSYIEIRKYSDEYDLLTVSLEDHQYEIFENAPGFSVYFNISDADNNDALVDNSSNPFIYEIILIDDGTETELDSTVEFNPTIGKHVGTVDLPDDVGLGTYTIKMTIKQLNYESITFTMQLSVKESTGIPEWILYAIIIGVVAVVGAIGVKRGIIDPRKRKYQEKVFRTASIFEDAINMQHILIIYKQTGTCLYFKSFTMDQIDPDLISGFLQAAQSFVRESMSSGGGLSEMKSGESNLLISDGEMVRITLVLSKPASQFLKTNLSRLVMIFENKYQEQLANWRGQLNIFKDADKLIDDVLHTSIILPHQVSTDIKKRKQGLSSMGRALVKIASGLTTADKNLFFIAQLVSEGKEKMKKDPQEILLGVNELINKEVIEPVDLSKYEAGGISDQELKLLAQKVADLPDFSDEEKKNLIEDLSEMNAAEREAALTSLEQGQKIESVTPKSIIKTKTVANEGEAKKEIKRLNKQAKKYLKDNDFEQAINSYDAAAVVAMQWNFEDIADEYKDKVLDTQMDRFDNKIKIGNKKVKKLIKSAEFEDAEEIAQEAYNAASSMFKLGFTDYQEDVKKFKNYLSEIERKKSDDGQAAGSKESKKSLLKQQRSLQKKANKLERKDELADALEIYSQLNIIADKLFKFGVVSASDDIKKYRVKINKLKKEIEESDDDSIDKDQLMEQRGKLLNIALQAEQDEDWLKALVAYQQVLNTYYSLGDTENASKLSSKISNIAAKIPNLPDVLEGIINGAEQKYGEGSVETAFAQYQYAKGICEAIGDTKKLKQIEKRIDELAEEL